VHKGYREEMQKGDQRQLEPQFWRADFMKPAKNIKLLRALIKLR
jgi:hypothetical protein